MQTEYEEVELEKNESCGGGMGMLMIILAVTRCEGILVKFFFFRLGVLSRNWGVRSQN